MIPLLLVCASIVSQGGAELDGAAPATSPDPAPDPSSAALLAPQARDPEAFGPREAEHLLNRAGFGARTFEVRSAVATGRAALLDRLLGSSSFIEDPFYARIRATKGSAKLLAKLPIDERRMRNREMRQEDQEQLEAFTRWWFERLVDGEDPLRERMTLFWHGFFTSSQQDVRNSHELIVQNQFLRMNALGSFRTLLHGIARDPAMLEYLDNDSNIKGNPNENFARELMELFTLGEGHYTEADIKEAARAFTGWSDNRGNFRFRKGKHDGGEKTVLGETGRWKGEDVLDILLRQEACGRYLAERLLAWFEGVTPAPERSSDYGRFLQEHDYDIATFLRRLFEDPHFYGDDVVGQRIAGPVDFLVGVARRLGTRPPGRFLTVATGILGQRLFYPPNVKGWAEGPAWITTSSIMQRANFAGVLLGEVRLSDFAQDAAMVEDDDMMSASTAGAWTQTGPSPDDATGNEADNGPGEAGEDVEPAQLAKATEAAAKIDLGEMRRLRGFDRMGWKPRLSFVAQLAREDRRRDGGMADALLRDLLAVDVGPETRSEVVRFLRRERQALGVENGELLDDPYAAEPLLRRVAHLILSLPEAQLQ